MVNETEVTSRNGFIVNVFALGCEKKNDERSLFRDCLRRLDLLYKNS